MSTSSFVTVAKRELWRAWFPVPVDGCLLPRWGVTLTRVTYQKMVIGGEIVAEWYGYELVQPVIPVDGPVNTSVFAAPSPSVAASMEVPYRSLSLLELQAWNAGRWPCGHGSRDDHRRGRATGQYMNVSCPTCSMKIHVLDPTLDVPIAAGGLVYAPDAYSQPTRS